MEPEVSAHVEGALRSGLAVLPDPHKLRQSPERVYAHGAADAIAHARLTIAAELAPVPMILHCPACGRQHIDAAEPDTGWENPPHKSHLCAFCSFIWRPADIATVGVLELRSHGLHDTVPQRRGRGAEAMLEITPGEIQWLQRDARAYRLIREIRSRGWMVVAHYDQPGAIAKTCWVFGHQVTKRFVCHEGLDDADALDRIATDVIPYRPGA